MKFLKRLFLCCLFVGLLAFWADVSSGWMPEPGDGVYRNMTIPGVGFFGHAGLYVGERDVIHMQGGGRGCCRDKLSTAFFSSYWGSIRQGDTNSAKERVKAAINIFNKHPQYSFTKYKESNDSYYRCDGLVEACFEKAGGNIINDWDWKSLSPLKQWKSISVIRDYVTNWGWAALYQ